MAYGETLQFVTDTRYYILTSGQDLLGDFILQRQWGSRYTKRRGWKIEVYLEQSAMEKTKAKILAIRKRHGYVQTEA